MQLADSRVFCANSPAELKEEEISRNIKEMIESLIALKSAPSAKEYRGPILLEGQSAAEFINELLRYNFGHAHEVLSSSENSASAKRNPLKNLLGQSIMPSFLTITDDPLSDKWHGHTIIGGHKIDEDGVPGQKIVLVDKGILKTFCTSRTPTPYTSKSNGHSVAGIGQASILYVDSENQLNAKQLKQKLIQLGKQAGLKQVMIARRLSTYDSAFFNPASLAGEVRANMASATSHTLFVRSPLLLYAVCVDDGHEELVRGALFSSIPIAILRNIVCTGNDTKSYFTLAMEPGELGYYHLICPSLLLNEIELHQPDKETDKLPIMPNPLTETK
jgi:predicted Zn-dependent protease